MSCPSVLNPVLCDRIDIVGRAYGLTDEEVFDEGSRKFNWKKIGVYSVEVENSSVVAVIHNPTNTKAVMPEDTGITTAFKLIKQWSEFGASFSTQEAHATHSRVFRRGRGTTHGAELVWT